jgi:hypothetical protein
MSTDAIIMFIVAITVIWGGLGVAILKLRQHTDPAEDERADGGGAE